MQRPETGLGQERTHSTPAGSERCSSFHERHPMIEQTLQTNPGGSIAGPSSTLYTQ